MCRYNVGMDESGQPPARKGQCEQLETLQAASPTVTFEAFTISPRHEMARTALPCRFILQQPVGANRLESMVLDDHTLTKEETEHQRHKRRSSEMNDIGLVQQPKQFDQARLSDNPEW